MEFLIRFCGTKKLFIVFITSFSMLVMDLAGIALIFPFLNLVITPELAISNRYFSHAYQGFEFVDTSEFVYACGIILFFLYLSKLVLKTILSAIKNRICSDITYRLSTHLFNGLLEAEYALFTEHSVSEIINIVNAQTIHSVICLTSFIAVINEFSFLLVVLGVVFYLNPEITFYSILFFLVLGSFIYFFLVKKIECFGKEHLALNNLVYKFGFAMANSIKDLKIMRLETNYKTKFAKIWNDYSQNDSRSKTARGITGDLSETLVFSGIVLVCLYVLASKQNIEEMIPVLGVLALSAIRILPSFNRIFSNYHEYKFYKPSFAMVRDLNNKIVAFRQSVKHSVLNFNKSLEVRDLFFKYEDRIIINDISLSISKGDSIGIVGESGSGKSTLLDILVGLRKSDAGEFYLDGIRFDPFKTDALKNYIGYVPQNVSLIDESLAFNISFEVDFDKQKMNHAVSTARLAKFVQDLPDGLHTILGESGVRVSGGQRQRIGIARALYRDPQILIFDEATSALDTVTERELMQEINQLAGHKTLVIVAHRLSTVRNCNVIHLLDGGRIIAKGSENQLLASSPEYRILYSQQDHI